MRCARTAVLVATLATAGITGGCGGAQIPAPPRPVAIANGEELVRAYYDRMNREDLEGVLALMVRQPVLIEPFTNARPTAHEGYRDVATFLANAFRTRDDQVVPEYVRAGEVGGTVEAGWSLQGSDGTGMSGVSRFVVRGGQVARVEIQLRE